MQQTTMVLLKTGGDVVWFVAGTKDQRILNGTVARSCSLFLRKELKRGLDEAGLKNRLLNGESNF